MKTSIGPKEIVFPTPVFIVGSYCEDGRPNAMNAAWGGICSSTPPCVAVSVREQRCTYENIMQRKAFTINIPSEEYVREADYFGLVSGKKTDKFQAAGLTPVKGDKVDAPYIKEFPFNIECRLVDTVKIGSHIQLIGEIMDVKVDENCIDQNGMPDISALKPMLFDPAAYNYHAVGAVLAQAFSIGKSLLTSQR